VIATSETERSHIATRHILHNQSGIKSMTKYFVVEENTLVYKLDNSISIGCGVLRASIGLGSRFSPTSIAYLDCVQHRDATARDFHIFKIALPPDFYQQSNISAIA